MQSPLRTYQLVAGATGAMLTEKMIFVISHDDEQNQCAVSVYSNHNYYATTIKWILKVFTNFTTIGKTFFIPWIFLSYDFLSFTVHSLSDVQAKRISVSHSGTIIHSLVHIICKVLLCHREMKILHKAKPSFKRSLSPLRAIWLATLPRRSSHMTWPTTWGTRRPHPLPTLAAVSSSRQPVCTSVDRLDHQRPFFST